MVLWILQPVSQREYLVANDTRIIAFSNAQPSQARIHHLGNTNFCCCTSASAPTKLCLSSMHLKYLKVFSHLGGKTFWFHRLTEVYETSNTDEGFPLKTKLMIRRKKSYLNKIWSIWVGCLGLVFFFWLVGFLKYFFCFMKTHKLFKQLATSKHKPPLFL